MATSDIEKLTQLTQEGDKIFLTPEGEQVILDFYAIKAQVEAAEQQIKEHIAEAAHNMNEHFSSIRGDRVIVSRRAYGAKYRVDLSRIQDIPKEFVTPKVTYKVE